MRAAWSAAWFSRQHPLVVRALERGDGSMLSFVVARSACDLELKGLLLVGGCPGPVRVIGSFITSYRLSASVVLI
jgi:hypothetical protein